MILVAGIADESPTAMVIEALDAIGAHFHVFDQRRAADTDIELEIADSSGGGGIDGTLRIGREKIPLDRVRGVFARAMDDSLLPGLDAVTPDAPVRLHCRRLHELLRLFADLAPARVLNRPRDSWSNHSKPFQAHVIRGVGFDVPDTLITNDPAAALEFIEDAWAGGGAVIYKSLSGIRSIVQSVERQDLARLGRIRWCPTQFQRHVPGTDIRVHVVGEVVLAAAIESEAADYRYAARQTGVDATMTVVELDRETRTNCIRVAQRLGLPLAGVDLRRTPDGRYVCFEVNPSPAFSFYERQTGLPIAHAIARHLAGEAD